MGSAAGLVGDSVAQALAKKANGGDPNAKTGVDPQANYNGPLMPVGSLAIDMGEGQQTGMPGGGPGVPALAPPAPMAPVAPVAPVKDLSIIQAPAMPTDLAPATVQGPTSFKGATIANVAGPQAATLQGMDNNQWAGYQQSLAAQLAARASGQGPSLAQLQGNQALAQNQAMAASQLASTRGAANNPFAARGAALAASQNAATIQQNIAQNRLAEQQSAQGLLGTLSTSARGQDIQIANANAGFQQDAALTKYRGDLQKAVAQGQIDQQTAQTMFTEASTNARTNAQLAQQYQDLKAKYIGMGLDADKANQMATLEIAKMKQTGDLEGRRLAMDTQSMADKRKQIEDQRMSDYLKAGAGYVGAIPGLVGMYNKGSDDSESPDSGSVSSVGTPAGGTEVES